MIPPDVDVVAGEHTLGPLIREIRKQQLANSLPIFAEELNYRNRKPTFEPKLP